MNNEQSFTVHDARTAAERDQLREWVAAFLASPGSDNAALARQLASQIETWIGPIELPFDDLHRLAGPPDQPTLGRLDEDDLDTVEGMGDSIDDGWDPPPLVVTLQDDRLVVEDGNHRIEGLRRAGVDGYWSIVGFANADDQQRFEARPTA